MKRAFEVKQKTFLPVSQTLSFKLTKQTSKNVAYTTFNTMAPILLNNIFTLKSLHLVPVFAKALQSHNLNSNDNQLS